nr:response regulator [Paracoccus fontiphilus]
MIVEDEPLIAFDLAQSLADAGFHVVGIARDKEGAVAKAAQGGIDLATMDVNLANRDSGIDTAIALRTGFGIPSLFVTSASQAVLSQIGHADPVGIIEKPAHPQDVIAAILRYFAVLGSPY